MKELSTTTNNRLTRVGAVIHAAVLLFLAVAGARYAASNYFVRAAQGSGSLDESQLAVRLQETNPIAHDALGTAFLRSNAFGDAAASYERAVAISPNDYHLWLHLCEVRSRSDERESALEACLRATELAPHYSLLNVQVGKLYLAAGEPDRAFEFLSKAVRNDQSYFDEVLNYASVAFAEDPDAIWRAVDPTSKKARSIVAAYFLDRNWMSKQAHAFLLGDELSREEKETAIRFLLEKKRYPLARELWLSKMELADTESKSPLFDGGFELTSENDQSGLGWQLEKVPFTTITLDSSAPHSGRAALKIRFAGNVEVRRPVFSQIAFIEPRKTYTLTFFVRSGELVSASLPTVLVVDPITHSLVARSVPIKATGEDWVQTSVTFTAPDGGAAIVSLQRPDCPVSPCPIFGDLLFDDIALVPSPR